MSHTAGWMKGEVSTEIPKIPFRDRQTGNLRIQQAFSSLHAETFGDTKI